MHTASHHLRMLLVQVPMEIVVDDGTHAAGGVAAAEWLSATLGGDYVNHGSKLVYARTPPWRETS